ncbi:MAG: tape measure protein [Clostridiaceae bacterium]|nr:tape measure protein [Clostridiaceae bacterium]
MATISSSVQMYDNMSPVINGITSALNMCISSFESMQSTSSHSIDTASLQAARQQLSGAEASFSQIEQNIRNNSNGQENFNNKLIQGGNSADGLATKLRNAVAVYATFKTLGDIFKTSDQLVQTQARLNLINDGLRTTDQLQTAIYQSAQRARATYTDTAAVVARMGTLAKSAFSNNDEMIAFVEQLNKQFKIGGASLEEQTAGMYQLSQSMASGRLQGDEFHSIMENAPLLAQAIATYTGKSMGDLRQMSSKGEITADIIKKALFATAADTEARFAKMPKTTGEIWTNMKNQALMAFQPVLLKINEIANNPNAMNFVNMMVNGFSTISIVALNLINTISNVAVFFQNNWGMIEPIILGIVGAIVAFNIATSICNAILAITGTLEAITTANAEMHAGATLFEAAATTTATGAQVGLNAALLACPITWIVLGIIALVAIFYLAIAVINKYAGTSFSATGLIAGAFWALGAAIYNVFVFAHNAVAPFLEFLLNAFNDPIGTVKRLFLGFAIGVIDSMIASTKGCDNFATNMANAIIKGINSAIGAWNKFVDLLNTAGIADKLGLSKGTELNYRTSITSDLQNAKGELEAKFAETMNNYINVPREEYLNIGDQFNKGYEWGAGIEKWAGNLMNPQQPNDQGQPFDYNDLLSKAANGADNAGKNTKDIKDKLDITSEDLKYLRDIADRDTINRFTTAEVKVDMTNHNNIGSELDLDGIIDNLGQAVSEGLQSVREGATYEL